MDDAIPWARMDRQQGQLKAMGFDTWQEYLKKHPQPPRYPIYQGRLGTANSAVRK